MVGWQDAFLCPLISPAPRQTGRNRHTLQRFMDECFSGGAFNPLDCRNVNGLACRCAANSHAEEHPGSGGLGDEFGNPAVKDGLLLTIA